MELYIQMGHGMQALSQELLAHWGNSTIIMSPVNIKPDRIKPFSTKIKKVNGKIMIDPQLYYPRKYHKTLSLYDYWPQNDITNLEAGDYEEVIKSLVRLNREVGSSSLILPSPVEQRVDRRWDARQKAIIDTTNKYASDIELLHTISLGSEVIIHEDQVEEIISFVEQWAVGGVYIVCEHPERYYLVDNPIWVTNLMSLVAGIKRFKKKVIVGYASHQLLCLALAKCDAIAAGNYLNVRWFGPERFETKEEEDRRRHATWYYCPQALSEFKVQFLDIANRLKLIDVMVPPHDMQNPYSEMLFGSALPSSTGYGRGESFGHYLHCLRQQSFSATRESYIETRDAHLIMLETAEQLLYGLSAKGIRGQGRDFGEIVDVNRAAIAAHDMAFEFPLSQEWDNL